MFLVPNKRGTNKWRLIIDLRELNKWCKTLKMSYEMLKHLRQRARAHDSKGVWEPTQAGPHLGLIADLQRGEFRAPKEKLIALAKAARSLMGRTASDKRWLSAR
eukprot:jgi/Tetstr1/428183/TSEL_018234.t1